MAVSRTRIEELYPEEYLVEEDDMSDNTAQTQLMLYLIQVLSWYYRLQNWFVIGNLQIKHPAIRNSQNKISPDVLVFKGIEIDQQSRDYMGSWRVDKTHPPPPVVFEIGSEDTWENDIELGERQKPKIYGRIGVREYYAYDPSPKRLWRGKPRLLGWRYNEQGEPIALTPDERGWLWSEELDSWLGAAGNYLRLYDQNGLQRLTGREAEEQARQQEEKARKAAQAKARKEAEARKAGEEARQEAEAAKAKAWAKLRELGIDPESL